MNKFASGNFFVCVCFFATKNIFLCTFDLRWRVGDKNFFTRSISENKTTFFLGFILLTKILDFILCHVLLKLSCFIKKFCKQTCLIKFSVIALH